MDVWQLVAERKIREAMEEGAFDHLEGTGKPLDLSENPFEDPSERMANRLLKNNGITPAWIQEAKEIPSVKVLDSASAPETRRPSWLLILVAGTFLGACMACFGYFLKNWWERWDQDDPRRMLMVQVFGGGRRMNFLRGMLQRRAEKPEETSQA